MTLNTHPLPCLAGMFLGMLIPLVAVAQDGGTGQAKTQSAKAPGKTPVDAAGTTKQTPQDILTSRRLADGYKPLVDLDANPGGKDRPFGLVQTPAWNPLYTKSTTGDTPEDIERAIRKADRDIAEQPNQQILYDRRARLKAEKRDYGGAIADCSRAIQIDPSNPILYALRGETKAKQGDADEALPDLDRAVALAPNAAYPYLVRSSAKRLKADYQGALVDADRAVNLAPTSAFAYTERAYDHSLLGHLQEALADYRSRCLWSETHQEYVRLFIWLTQKRLGQNEAADAELSDYLDRREHVPSREWGATVGKFLLGRITEDDLFSAALSPEAAKESDQRCEAYYYSAMKKLLAADKAGAVADFQQCLDTRRKTFVEYQFALVELNALSQ